ncbi:MAG: HAMP domain-containing histidine kinase [Alphaproteobacteria bacterium]|nr:HAMP domain-containing histidine kinase [Alphaproteobacteria bacterium]
MQREILDSIRATCAQLLATTDATLRRRRVPGPVHVERVVASAWRTVAGMAWQRGVHWRPRVHLDTSVLADRDLLTRALVTLLTNAIEATPPGGDVGVYAGPAAAEVAIRVWDTGSGLGNPPPHAHRPGRGLGLYIAERYVRIQGGRIDIAPSTEGTIMCVILPAAPRS